MEPSTFSAIVIMVTMCASGPIDASGNCQDGKPGVTTELHLLTGDGAGIGLSFDDADADRAAQETKYVAVLKQRGKVIASIPRENLDDNTIAALWRQMNGIGKTMRSGIELGERVHALQKQIHEHD
jgi:hypothetical protein